jgi:hypothetical protein
MAVETYVWLEEYFLRHHLDPDNLTSPEWFNISRVIPCHIRCWRIGAPVDVKPGTPCPECGKLRPLPTRYDRLMSV